MDYRDFAKDLLKKRAELVTAKTQLNDEITMLDEIKFSAKNTAVGDTRVAPGGGSRYEDSLVSVIFRLDDAIVRKRLVERELRQIESGMSSLSEYEKELLYEFYIKGEKYASERIGAKYYKERSAVYADKKKALEKFTRSIYGIVRL